MTSENERLEILEMIQQGRISAQEGLKLIEALEESWDDIEIMEEETSSASEEILPAESGEHTEDFNRWRAWWIIPFWIGIGITVLGSALMYWGWSVDGPGVGFILAWIPFLIGIAILILGWNSRTGPWIHIRIRQKPGETPQRIAISLPLPMRFFAWSIKTFGQYVKGLDATGLDEVILALRDRTPGEPPLSINVSDDAEGEQVNIYFG
jgi:hypothetical protein